MVSCGINPFLRKLTTMETHVLFQIMIVWQIYHTSDVSHVGVMTKSMISINENCGRVVAHLKGYSTLYSVTLT